jgi:hypothetical protein
VSPKVNVVLSALVLACNGFWLYSLPEWRLLYERNEWPDIILRHLFFFHPEAIGCPMGKAI